MRRFAPHSRSGADSVSLEKLMADDYYAVGIRWTRRCRTRFGLRCGAARRGDRLVVPEYVSTVKINGDVMYPNTTVYLKDKRVKYYIAQAGGYGARAKRNKAYIVYMNGRVAREGPCEGGAGLRDHRSVQARSQADGHCGDSGSDDLCGVDRHLMAASIANMTK